MRPARTLRSLYGILLAAYGPQDWWPAKTPFEVVIGAYLTQNTAWRSVERSIENLRGRELLSPQGIRAISIVELQELIRPSGYMIRKAAALKAFVSLLDNDYGGSLEALSSETTVAARAKLLALPGVGPETADAILLYALEHPVMVVDEYLRRIASRHGICDERPSYASLQTIALQAFDLDPLETRAQHFNEFHALVVEVGKRHCRQRPNCTECPLLHDLISLERKRAGKLETCR